MTSHVTASTSIQTPEPDYLTDPANLARGSVPSSLKEPHA